VTVLTLATLGSTTEKRSFLFYITLPKVAKAGTSGVNFTNILMHDFLTQKTNKLLVFEKTLLPYFFVQNVQKCTKLEK